MKKIFEAIKDFFRRLEEKYEAWKTKKEAKKRAKEQEQFMWDENHPHAAELREKIKLGVVTVSLFALCVGGSVALVAAGWTPPTPEERLKSRIEEEIYQADQYGITNEERQEHLRMANDSITALNRLNRMNNPDIPDTTIKIDMGV